MQLSKQKEKEIINLLNYANYFVIFLIFSLLGDAIYIFIGDFVLYEECIKLSSFLSFLTKIIIPFVLSILLLYIEVITIKNKGKKIICLKLFMFIIFASILAILYLYLP